MSDDLLDDARFIYVHLNHPCREIDVWRTTQPEEKRIALRQGYVSLVSLRQLEDENERLLAACQHAVEHHRPYVDESGVVCITLQSYAMIKSIVIEQSSRR